VIDVAARVGHASPKMTQDRYGHAMPHADDRALDRLAAAKAARRGERLRVVS
jgi:integrase